MTADMRTLWRRINVRGNALIWTDGYGTVSLYAVTSAGLRAW